VLVPITSGVYPIIFGRFDNLLAPRIDFITSPHLQIASMPSRASTSTRWVRLATVYIPVGSGTSLGPLKVTWYDRFIVQLIQLV